MDLLDLSPIDADCMRCGRRSSMRVPGLCEPCRDELAERFAPRVHDVEAAPYEPTMHVTPNAVALKEP